MKKEMEKSKDIFPWGTLFKEISPDSLVMQFAVKDNALLLFQSTIHTGMCSDWLILTVFSNRLTFIGDEPVVMNLRKRPKSTSSKAKTARAPFGSNYTQILPIQQFNDSYNHNMNHVDQADQLRCYSESLRHNFKGWKALFQFIFNIALVNAYLLSYHSPHEARFTD